MRVLSLLLCSFLLPIDAAVVDYTLVISEMRSVPPNSPDCFTDRDMLLVNGTNPGPTLRASVGDTVRVTLINMSMERSVALHFHGISMYGYPYSDGTNLETSCSLPPTEVSERGLYLLMPFQARVLNSLDLRRLK
jgi:FtsP/CotA-like multicopper oxidase with cupredoxin domain